MRKVKLQVTPITDTTFERQGWSKHIAADYNGVGDFFENREDVDSDEETLHENEENLVYSIDGSHI